jgi:N-formylmaleamate deformylase
MNRRAFLTQAAAFALVASSPVAAATQPRRRFAPTRFTAAVEGRGRDVILLPGLTSGREVFERAVRDVPGFRYHRILVNGFAGTPSRGNAEGPVLAPLVGELAAYIEAEGLGRPAIVGHSMGGTLGMMLAARYPARVGRLMIVDMLPRPSNLFGGTGGMLGRLAESLGGVIGDAQGRALISSLVSAFIPPGHGARRSDPDLVSRALHDLGTVDLTSELRAIRAPTTILYATPEGMDAAAADRIFADAYRGLRGARLERVDHSGHVIMADQPGIFARSLRRFLA